MMDKGRYYCGHCQEKISKTLYFTHKRLYYNCDTGEWVRKCDLEPASPEPIIEEFTFPDDDNSVSEIM